MSDSAIEGSNTRRAEPTFENVRCIGGVAVPIEFAHGWAPKGFHFEDGTEPVDPEAYGTEDIGAHQWEEMFHIPKH